MLLVDALRQPLFALGGADLRLDVAELLLRRLDLVVCPALKPVSLLLEEPVVGLEGGCDGGVDVTPALGREPLRAGSRNRRRLADLAVATEQQS